LSVRSKQSLKPAGASPAGTRGPNRGGQLSAGLETKAQIVRAAIDTVKAHGFAGASARTIARTGGFNQALIFYHFGTVNRLLLAALDETSAQRMARYEAAVAGARALPDLMREAAEIYREDLRSGHIKVLAELIAASSTHPELGPEIVRRVEPWIDFTRDAIARMVAGSPFEALVPAEDLAYAVVALFLGVELLTHMDAGGSRGERLIDSGTRAATLLAPLVGLGGEAL
jgi:AcrR family transcriptional regulator